MPDRYDMSTSSQGQYQPGSNGQVLSNQLAITDLEIMEQVEFDALVALEKTLFEEITTDQYLRSTDLCQWHRRWLTHIYKWAGQYRSVNLSKGNFVFAASHRIPELMLAFENDYLLRYTPCDEMGEKELAEAIAACHIEFIIIHPFREGNGRLGRLLATIMALQAGMPPLDFSIIEQNPARYINAIHYGHSGDNSAMTELFLEVLQFTLNQSLNRDNGF